MKVLDLFSGIGGFSLGLEAAGMETVAFCEFDKHARKVLEKNWPKIKIHNDVKYLDGGGIRALLILYVADFPAKTFQEQD